TDFTDVPAAGVVGPVRDAVRAGRGDARAAVVERRRVEPRVDADRDPARAIDDAVDPPAAGQSVHQPGRAAEILLSSSERQGPDESSAGDVARAAIRAARA